MTAPNRFNRDRYAWDARSTLETLEPEFAVIWLRRQANRWHEYDWDTLTQSCTDMTETPKKICSRFSIVHTWDIDRLKNNEGKIWGVSVIWYGSYMFKFGPYHYKLWFERLKLRLSIISVPTVDLGSHWYRYQLNRFGVVILGTSLCLTYWGWLQRAISANIK